MVARAQPPNASGDEGLDGQVVAIGQLEASRKNQPNIRSTPLAGFEPPMLTLPATRVNH
jgi:hypothetical protein